MEGLKRGELTANSSMNTERKKHYLCVFPYSFSKKKKKERKGASKKKGRMDFPHFWGFHLQAGDKHLLLYRLKTLVKGALRNMEPYGYV